MANVISIRIEADGTATVINGLNGVADAGEKMGKKVGGSKDAMEGSWQSMAKGVAVGTLLAKAFELLAEKAMQAGQYIKDSAYYAARVETLGVAMHTVGQNAGYSAAQMDAHAKSVQKMGISVESSRQSLTMMAAAQMDVTTAAQMARIAQDAAVIGNINSSEAFQRMTQGIRSGELEVLRTIGIQVNFEQAYKKTAQTLGITTAQLTEQQKVMARQNAVLEYGVNIQGVYDAAMETTGKKVTSLQRYYDNLKFSIGEAFSPALGVLVTSLTEHLVAMGNWMRDNKDDIKEFANFFSELAKNVAHPIDALKGKILHPIDSFFPSAQSRADYAQYKLQTQSKIERDRAVKEQTRMDRMAKARAAQEKEEKKRLADALKKKEHYTREGDLLLKNIVDYQKQTVEQEKAFYELGQDLERTAAAEKAAFNIGTMLSGDMKTDRYKATPLSQYRLRTDKQYSLSQSGPDAAAERQAAMEARRLEMELNRDMLTTQKNEADLRLSLAQTALDAELEQRIDQANKLKVSEEKKWDIMLRAEEVYNAKKQKLTEVSWSSIGGIVSGQLGAVANMMNKTNADQFAAYKAMMMAQATINAAMAISNILASPLTATLGMFAIPLAFATGGIAAAQIALIAGQEMPARALGGPVYAGKSVLVGERGPEIFTPGASGQITSNDKLNNLGGQTVNVTPVFQISTGVSDTVRAEVMRLAPYIVNQSVAAVKSAMRAGQFQGVPA
jgi:hypothetical protein